MAGSTIFKGGKAGKNQSSSLKNRSKPPNGRQGMREVDADKSYCYNFNMRGYIANIEKESLGNENFRKVLYTAKNSQLVLMSLKPDQDIGEEVHELDQFIRCEAGQGKAILDNVEHEIKDGFAIVVPAGTKHNIINTSKDKALKLYTLYSPPNHRDRVIHQTKEQAVIDEEHFDGITTE